MGIHTSHIILKNFSNMIYITSYFIYWKFSTFSWVLVYLKVEFLWEFQMLGFVHTILDENFKMLVRAFLNGLCFRTIIQVGVDVYGSLLKSNFIYAKYPKWLLQNSIWLFKTFKWLSQTMYATYQNIMIIPRIS